MAGGEVTVGLPDWHFLLLSLAGRLSDDVIARCRGWLDEEHQDQLGQAVISAVIAQEAPLFDAEVEMLVAAGARPDELSRVQVAGGGAPMRYEFAAEWPATGDVLGAEVAAAGDAAVVDAARAGSGARGLWRSWRIPTGDAPSQVARRVYTVEADEDADLALMTRTIQDALAQAGEVDPQVEVYPTGTELPVYQRFAQAYGGLLWSRSPDPGVRIAVLFDDVDPASGPRFNQDHELADAEELPQLASYLNQGEAVLVTTALLDDVVEPARGAVVPMSFRTDGMWVWSDATTYYLKQHALMPDPELVAHIRAVDYVAPQVDGVGMHRAMAALQVPVDEEPVWTYGG